MKGKSIRRSKSRTLPIVSPPERLEPTRVKSKTAFDVRIVWNLFKFLPLLTVLVYAAGYVVNMSYLDSMGIHYIHLVNSTFFRSGFPILVLVFLIVFLVYSNFPEPTDDLAVAIRYVPYAFGYTFWISPFLAYFFTLGTYDQLQQFIAQPLSRWLLYVFIVTFIAVLYATSYAARSLTRLKKGLIILIPTFAFYLFSLEIAPPATKILLKLLVGTALIAFLFLGTYGDRELRAYPKTYK